MPDAIGIVRAWMTDRRVLAESRANATVISTPPTVHRSWRGADTTTRDLAIEQNLLAELLAELLRTEDGRRQDRWSRKAHHIRGDHRIARVSWAQAAHRADMVAQAIDGLLRQAQDKGADLGDLTIVIEPDALPPGTIRIELRGVSA